MPRGETARGEAWLQVRVPKEAKAQLEARVGRDGPSLSWVARKLLLDALAAAEQAEARKSA